MRRGLFLRSLALGAATLLSAGARGAVLDVYPDGTGPYPNLLAATLAAQPGDTIRLADGVFAGAANRNLILGGMELTICSAGGVPELCIIDLEGDGRAFLIQSRPGTAVRVAAITLRGGNPNLLPPDLLPGYGGGVAIRGVAPCGSVVVEGCVFEDARAEAGGGAFIYQAEAQFLGCTFRHNLATDGAGAYCGYCESGAGVRFAGCVFFDNDYPYPSVGGYGAGLYYSHSRGSVEACTLSFNRAWIGAGLIVSTASTVAVVGDLIAFSTEGEGLAVTGGSVTVSHCDIYGNQGGDWIGAIAGFFGTDCNVAVDPIFCDGAGRDLTLRADSPCLPEHSGGCGLIGALGEGCDAPFSDVQAGGSLAESGERLMVFPSPGRGPATIAYSMAQAGRMRLEVFAADGRHVATLTDGFRAAGEHRMEGWGVTDERGRGLAAGLYFLRLETPAGKVSRPVVLVR